MCNKSKVAGALFLAITSFSTFAVEKVAGWTFLASVGGSDYYSKDGSLRESKGVRSIIFQDVPASKSGDAKVLYGRFTIPLQACKDEIGQITIYELSGKVAGKYDYVKGGSNVAAYIADMICLGTRMKEK